MPSILIINSDEYLLESLTKIFKHTDYTIIATTDSSIAIQLFNKHNPCAIIIDIYMGEKDAFEVTKEIREICQKVFIMVISSSEKHLDTIAYLGADLALPVSTHPEFIINAIAVAEKAQNYSNENRSLSHKFKRKKKLLKIA